MPATARWRRARGTRRCTATTFRSRPASVRRRTDASSTTVLTPLPSALTRPLIASALLLAVLVGRVFWAAQYVHDSLEKVTLVDRILPGLVGSNVYQKKHE